MYPICAAMKMKNHRDWDSICIDTTSGFHGARSFAASVASREGPSAADSVESSLRVAPSEFSRETPLRALAPLTSEPVGRFASCICVSICSV